MDSDGSTSSLTRIDYIESCYSLVKIPGAPQGDYSSIQDAYDNANDGDTIRSRTVTFTENLDFNRPISVNIEGGWNCDYIGVTGWSSLIDNITISDGMVTIQSGTIEVI